MKLEQELVILGLLKDKPRHGYEIKKQINDFLTYFTGLEYESTYYSLSSLEKKGIVKKTVASSKNRPNKYVYSLTAKGKERFSMLLDRSFLHIQRPYFGIDISLYFLPYLKPESVHRKLRARLRILKKIELNLLQIYSAFRTQKPPHLLAILEHNLELIKAEVNFISGLITRFNKK
ncbi:PadR family transcriptional regulator [bacterium]|nr:PadR family transcriptional regulator [bacterium]